MIKNTSKTYNLFLSLLAFCLATATAQAALISDSTTDATNPTKDSSVTPTDNVYKKAVEAQTGFKSWINPKTLGVASAVAGMAVLAASGRLNFDMGDSAWKSLKGVVGDLYSTYSPLFNANASAAKAVAEAWGSWAPTLLSTGGFAAGAGLRYRHTSSAYGYKDDVAALDNVLNKGQTMSDTALAQTPKVVEAAPYLSSRAYRFLDAGFVGAASAIAAPVIAASTIKLLGPVVDSWTGLGAFGNQKSINELGTLDANIDAETAEAAKKRIASEKQDAETKVTSVVSGIQPKLTAKEIKAGALVSQLDTGFTKFDAMTKDEEALVNAATEAQKVGLNVEELKQYKDTNLKPNNLASISDVKTRDDLRKKLLDHAPWSEMKGTMKEETEGETDTRLEPVVNKVTEIQGAQAEIKALKDALGDQVDDNELKILAGKVGDSATEDNELQKAIYVAKKGALKDQDLSKIEDVAAADKLDSTQFDAVKAKLKNYTNDAEKVANLDTESKKHASSGISSEEFKALVQATPDNVKKLARAKSPLSDLTKEPETHENRRVEDLYKNLKTYQAAAKLSADTFDGLKADLTKAGVNPTALDRQSIVELKKNFDSLTKKQNQLQEVTNRSKALDSAIEGNGDHMSNWKISERDVIQKKIGTLKEDMKEKTRNIVNYSPMQVQDSRPTIK